MISESAVWKAPVESEVTRRARYAANQRHNKARQASKDSSKNEGASEADDRAAERKQLHREKNRIAAAKCRSRQREQMRMIREKEKRLGEKNIELKNMIEELRRELNRLKSRALDHEQCNCDVTRYNYDQAEGIAAYYRSLSWPRDAAVLVTC